MSFRPITNSEKKLFYLIQSDSLSKFESIYLNGTFVNKQVENSQRVSFLGEAVKRNALKIANFIIDEDPSEMMRKDSEGNLALSYLNALEPKKEMIELFERKGFDFSEGVGIKGNILHVIAPKGELSLFKSLVEKGAKPTELNAKDDKPQDIAKRWGNVEVESYIDNNYTVGKQGSFDFGM